MVACWEFEFDFALAHCITDDDVPFTFCPAVLDYHFVAENLSGFSNTISAI
jgi:hypothetical protein